MSECPPNPIQLSRAHAAAMQPHSKGTHVPLHVEEVSMTAPKLKDAANAPLALAATVLQSWVGLGLD